MVDHVDGAEDTAVVDVGATEEDPHHTEADLPHHGCRVHHHLISGVTKDGDHKGVGTEGVTVDRPLTTVTWEVMDHGTVATT